MFESLTVIRALEKQRREIVQIERRLCEPLLTDTSLIRNIYEIVSSEADMNKTESKQIFIMLVLFFYSPKKLVVGTKIGQKPMNAMCEVTGLSQPLLSTYSRNLVFFYQHYYHFKDLTDSIMAKVRVMLVNNNISAERLEEYMWRFKNKE